MCMEAHYVLHSHKSLQSIWDFPAESPGPTNQQTVSPLISFPSMGAYSATSVQVLESLLGLGAVLQCRACAAKASFEHFASYAC